MLIDFLTSLHIKLSSVNDLIHSSINPLDHLKFLSINSGYYKKLSSVCDCTHEIEYLCKHFVKYVSSKTNCNKCFSERLKIILYIMNVVSVCNNNATINYGTDDMLQKMQANHYEFKQNITKVSKIAMPVVHTEYLEHMLMSRTVNPQTAIPHPENREYNVY
ncbi:hypothetical protein C0J52_15877 [Blattella germanica]|nr:hypothetical protein C0J52_15877 [Blattella germanica]